MKKPPEQKIDHYNNALDRLRSLNYDIIMSSDELVDTSQTHRIIYDKIYELECLIYAEIKNQEKLKKELDYAKETR